MKFKDLFKVRDNSYYETRVSSSTQYLRDYYKQDFVENTTDIYITKYKVRPKYFTVYLNEPWYNERSIYFLL